MRNISKTVSVLFIVLYSITFAQVTNEIIDLGTGGISGISNNGQFVCGMSYPSPAFLWSESTGRIDLGSMEFSEAYGVSNNGKVAGRFYDPSLPAPGGNPTLRAGYWENGNWNALVGLPGLVPLDETSFTHAYGISGDGSRIAGMQWHENWTVEAVYWENDTIVGLGQTNGGNSRANVLSFDGSIIAGWNAGPGGVPDRSAYYWDPAPHFMGGFDPAYLVGESRGINSDGSVIVGGSVWPFIWTAATGMQQVVADSSDYWSGDALGISDNGTIVGFVDPGGFNYQAFIKKPGWSDIVYLSTYISDSLGITGYTDWYFAFGQAISADGKTIGISAYSPAGEPKALLLKIDQQVPVELASFTATTDNQVVNLNWSTATELNNSGFEIQKVNQNSIWIPIGFINGNGTTANKNDYNFIDQNPLAGINKYRLKQVDFDGSFEYSHEVEVEIVPQKYILNQNYPNPFNPETKINFSISKEEFVKVRVFNSLGEEVEVLFSGQLNAGSHTLSFNGENYASGLYILKLTAGNFSQTIKMNLIK